MVCRNICKKTYSEIVVRESHYSVEKRYCRRCECFFVTDKKFCQSCGMQLRLTPSEGEYKEEMGENMIIINTKKAAGRNNSPGSGS
jgi:hypothetical protein